MVQPTGQLEKMIIRSYSKPEMGESDLLGEFTVFINPENYAQEYKIEYNEEQGQGTSSGNQSFQQMPPQQMSFDFLFDRTGVLPDSPPQDRGVMPDLEKLKDLTYEYKGDMHRPPYLSLTWGELYFQCVLLSLNFQYKLFRPDGTPLRAVVKFTAKEFKDEELRAQEENNQSPDLTHLRQVIEGDHLSLMSHRIYGDPKHYLEVARTNELVNFRRLTAGRQLAFPPLDQQN